MRIDLEEGEYEDLREAVRAYLKGLFTELARADQRKYRTMLRDKCARFERVLARLDRVSLPGERAIVREKRT